MADQVELIFREAAERLIPRGARVLAAVSGGPDSVALLHLLLARAAGGGLELAVAHLDHGMRAGSAEDRRFVQQLARDASLPCFSVREDVPARRRSDESPLEAARRVRRRFLVQSAEKSRADWIATGHHLDDQAETVLMRLVRGGGARALGGMAPSGPGPFVRPLLEIEKHRLRDYLARHGLAFREDPSNRDLRFDRNRVRRLILPLLAEELNPRAARHLVHAARLIREDALHLDALAAEAFEDLARRDRAGRICLDAKALAGHSPAIGKRLARMALERAGADTRRVTSRHVDSLLDLARGGRGRRVHLPGGLHARRDAEVVLVES